MPFATSEDCEIYYETQGSGNQVIVFVSGYMGIADIWAPLAAHLCTQHHCITFDNRGYGRSSKPPSSSDYSVEKFASDIVSILNSLRIHHPVLLVTHSFGSLIASEFFLQHLHRVKGIVYTGTVIDGMFDDPEAAVHALTQNGHLPSAAVQFYTDLGLSRDIALEAAKWSCAARENFARCMVNFSLGGRWSEIVVPTLVVQGEEDSVTSPEVAQKLNASLPQSRLKLLEGVKHFSPTEAPERLGCLIEEFVDSLSN
jgi:pimeloyl-ACP methyl ester carboxylesterase